MKRCITRLTQGIFEMSASLKPVFSTSSCAETALYTARDEKQKEKKNKKRPHSYQNYSTNTGSCTQ